jgi:hypothetical protein
MNLEPLITRAAKPSEIHRTACLQATRTEANKRQPEQVRRRLPGNSLRKSRYGGVRLCAYLFTDLAA